MTIGPDARAPRKLVRRVGLSPSDVLDGGDSDSARINVSTWLTTPTGDADACSCICPAARLAVAPRK